MSKRCKHETRVVVWPGDTLICHHCGIRVGRVCKREPANDEPEAVCVEIEAASMSHVNPDGLLWDMTLPGATQHTHEALCLAYAIATHEESQ